MTNKIEWEGHTPLPDSRFWSRVDRRGPDECWPWTGTLVGGYGTVGGERATHISLRVHGVLKPSHARLVRHHCDNPACVNPAHLAWGTHKENADDMVRRKRHHNNRKTHCHKGHPLSGENLILRATGGRGCRQCGRDRSREWMRQSRQALAISEKSE